VLSALCSLLSMETGLVQSVCSVQGAVRRVQCIEHTAVLTARSALSVYSVT